MSHRVEHDPTSHPDLPMMRITASKRDGGVWTRVTESFGVSELAQAMLADEVTATVLLREVDGYKGRRRDERLLAGLDRLERVARRITRRTRTRPVDPMLNLRMPPWAVEDMKEKMARAKDGWGADR